MTVEIKPDYETVLIDTIASLSEALKRKKVFADDWFQKFEKSQELAKELNKRLDEARDTNVGLVRDHGDNLAASNERVIEIARLKHENQSLKDRLDIALGKLRELRRRKR